MDDKKQKSNKSKHTTSSSSINVPHLDELTKKEKNKYLKSMEKKYKGMWKNFKNIFHNKEDSKSKTSVNSDMTNNLNNRQKEISIESGPIGSSSEIDNIQKSTSMIQLSASNSNHLNKPERETSNENEISAETKPNSCATTISINDTIMNILTNNKVQVTSKKCLKIDELKAKLLFLSPEGI